MRSCFLGLFLFFLSGFSVADTYPASGSYTANWGDPRPSDATLADAAARFCAAHGASYGWGCGSVSSVVSVSFGCFNEAYLDSNGTTRGAYSCAVSVAYSCPYGGTWNGSYSSATCDGAPSCPGGTSRNALTGACDPPPCQAGQSSIADVYVGWAPTTLQKDDWISFVYPTTACSGSCQLGSVQIVSGSCLVDPSVGPPYPGHCSFSGVTTGQACTASEQALDDVPSPIPCPSGSAIGSINGVAGCYKTSTSSSNTTVSTASNGDVTEVKTQVGPNGTETVTTKVTHPDQSIDISVSTIGPSSPGDVPVPGEGPGDGPGEGPGEGPGDDDGVGEEGDTEQAKFCRENPTVVMCQEKVKVDETDTPDGEGVETPYKTSMEQTFNQQKALIEGNSWKVGSLGWSMPFSVPAGSCHPVTIFNKVLDVCPVLGMCREVMAWAYAMLAAFMVWTVGVRNIGRTA